MQSIDAATLSSVFALMADDMLGRIDAITDADRAIGDGDHGIGVQRAFVDIKQKLSETGVGTPAEVWRVVGAAFIGKTGGAAGAIFGTFFLAGTKGLTGRAELAGADVVAALQAGQDAVIARGGANPGDKTIVDVIVPALAAAKKTQAEHVTVTLKAVAAASRAGKERTKDMVARFGKAKALGNRNLGHPDPGCMTLNWMFESIAEHAENFLEV